MFDPSDDASFFITGRELEILEALILLNFLLCKLMEFRVQPAD